MPFIVRENVSLADLTTLKIGGAARFFVAAESESEIIQALEFAKRKNLKVFILGGGSNVLISDEGFNGLVLQVKLKGISIQQKENKTFHVSTGAGENWDFFVKFCIQKNLQGIECLSGIPGSVGGTPVQNVGAYGQEVSETIVSVKVLEVATLKIFEMSNLECGFAYRSSIFNGSKKNCFIVLSVTFSLVENGKPKIVYKDLQEFFVASNPNLEEAREAILKIRRRKSMVIDVSDPNSKSAGSFFKNPIVSLTQFNEIQSKARELGFIKQDEKVPSFYVNQNYLKIPAAWLIEKSGFHKGFRLGQVGLSTKHTLAIVNLGNAKARDVLKIKNLIQTKTKEKFAVELTPEPVFIGFE